MLKECAREYFINQDKNCSETALKVISDCYGLGLQDKDLKLVSAFGAGMGCGALCGVLAGCMAGCGALAVSDRAHATEGFGDLCAALHQAFDQKLGGSQCAELKPKYRTEEERCLKCVELGLELFEEFAAEHQLGK